jgi:hypothetical protein
MDLIYHTIGGAGVSSTVDAVPKIKADNKTETRDLVAKNALIRLCKPNVPLCC